MIKLKNYLPSCATKKHFLTAPPQIHDNAEDAANASQQHKTTHAH